jgi:hypothetical protein
VAITAFSNLTITISDGGTVPSIDYLSKKTFVNIGSGNVLKISWKTPTATNNAVDNYKVYVLWYNPAKASYQSLYTANIGNVNEFYLRSSSFDSIQQSVVTLRIYVDVISKYGAAYNGTSNIESVYVSRGCGAYTRVEEGYAQPIMKRAIAFARIDSIPALTTYDDIQVADANGNTIYAAESTTQDEETGWTLMQEFYIPGVGAATEVALVDAEDRVLTDANDAQLYAATDSQTRKVSDIRYEVLTDANGEIILDPNGQKIYVL